MEYYTAVKVKELQPHITLWGQISEMVKIVPFHEHDTFYTQLHTVKIIHMYVTMNFKKNKYGVQGEVYGGEDMMLGWGNHVYG